MFPDDDDDDGEEEEDDDDEEEEDDDPFVGRKAWEFVCFGVTNIWEKTECILLVGFWNDYRQRTGTDIKDGH